MRAVGELVVISARLRVAQVNESIRGEVRMRHHLEESTLTRVEHFRHAIDGLGSPRLPLRMMRSRPGRSVTEYVAARQKRNRPGLGRARRQRWSRNDNREEPTARSCRRRRPSYRRREKSPNSEARQQSEHRVPSSGGIAAPHGHRSPLL